VTGSPASSLLPSNKPFSTSAPDKKTNHQTTTPHHTARPTPISTPNYHQSSAVPIPTKPAHHGQHRLATPPLTPEDKNGDTIVNTSLGKTDALDFLVTIFPSDGFSALPFARSVSISAPNTGATFDGVVLELPGTPKTLYVDGKSAATVSLRESIVVLLDLADESLQCPALVISLERSSPMLAELLHSLMYVGGVVVTKPPFKVNPTYVLVGMEI